MSTAPWLEVETREDLGTLANNGIAVLSLQTSLSKAEINARIVPKLLIRMAREQSWRSFILGHDSDKVFRWNAADFRRFIESPRPGGCQTPIHVLERMVRDTDAWPVFLELTRGEPGGANNPQGNNQWNEVKYHDVILDQEPPATIPIPASRKPPCGNSTSYVLRQLENGRRLKSGEVLPARPDLLARVKAGEITPHAAAVLGGFDGKSITIPADPNLAVRRLVKHFRGDALEALIRGLANWAGIALADGGGDHEEPAP